MGDQSSHTGPVTPNQPVRKTILIFSSDLNLCFSLSLLFQDRYHVVTTTNIAMIETAASCFGANLAIVDEVPSECLISRLEKLGAGEGRTPVIMLYVYNARDVALDRAIRSRADTVFYKPVEITTVSKRIDEILAA